MKEFKIGDKVEVKAMRVPIYANDYYTPSYKESKKVLDIVRVFGDNAYCARVNGKAYRLKVRNDVDAVLSSNKAKWELEL
jgi:hypothetical protein